jgi:hypothetical protein
MQGVSWIGGSGSLSVAAADLTGLVEQVQANVESVQLCTAYYLSHAYVKVSTFNASILAQDWIFVDVPMLGSFQAPCYEAEKKCCESCILPD